MIRLLPFLLALALIVPACSDDAPTNPDSSTSSSNSFTVNGSGYTEAAFKGYNGDTAGVALESSGTGVIGFSGKTPNANEYFAISLTTESTAVGGYQVSATSDNYMTLVIFTGSSSRTYLAGTGSIDIKTWGKNGRASGTFSGSFVDPANPTATPLQVTAGKFDVDIES